MAKMDPVSGRSFKIGNTTVPPNPAPDFDFAAMAQDPTIVLIATVDKFGAVTVWNHPKTPAEDKLSDISGMFPYDTGGLYDVTNLALAIYADKENPSMIELGVWNPGPPKKCYT